MAHHMEPMDIDSEFDNKENSFHHSNVLPCTEKGYEELDVSELNMKLRYSVTPASSPMSKSYTANCVDRILDSGEDSLNVTINENANLTRSLNLNMKNDNVIKSLKALPLQSLSTEFDGNRNTSVLRPLDTMVIPDNATITVSVSGPNDIDENLSVPSSSSSTVQTPEVTTPTKDIPKTDGGSPIMRGLKSVLNMFRSSQSPIPPAEGEDVIKQEALSPAEAPKPDNTKTVIASTPIASQRKKETSPSKRNSPYKESIVFNEDLEKDLQWKDETTILFSQERIPIHKLFFQQPDAINADKLLNEDRQDADSTVEYMDISYNDTVLKDRTMTETQNGVNKTEGTIAGESDSEFVDCETTFTKNESVVIDDKEIPVNDQTQELTSDTVSKNENTSKLKPIILNTTQDILDATLSITPEDLNTEVLDSTKDLPVILPPTETNSTKDLPGILPPTETNSTKDLPGILPPIETNNLDIKNNMKLVETSNETIDIETSIETKDDLKLPANVQKIDQTFDIASQSICTEPEQLNSTKTIESNANGIISQDQASVELAEEGNLNETVAIDNIYVENTSLKQEEVTVFISNVDNLNTTHTVVDAHVEQIPEDHFENITNAIANISAEDKIIIDQVDAKPEHVDAMTFKNKIIENKLQGRADVKTAEILNPANEYNTPVDSKIIEDHGHIPVLENNNMITEHEFALECYELNITKQVSDGVVNDTTTVKEPNLTVETFCETLLENDIPILLDEKPFQLPADIPLPDEDDIDKEIDITVDNTTININTTVSNSMPPDLVDDIKLNAEITDNTNLNSTTVTDNMTVHPEVLPKDTISNEEIVVKSNCVKVSEHVGLQDIKSIESIALSSVSGTINNDMLPEFVPSPMKSVIEQESTVTTDPLHSFKEFNENLPIIENINEEISQNEKQKLTLDVPAQIDINESVCAFKPLPDIINQTITMPCQENIEQVVELVEQIPQSESAIIGDSIDNNGNDESSTKAAFTDMHNIPQESGDIDSCKKIESTDDPPQNNPEEIAIVTISEDVLSNNDAIENMNIDEKMENIENVQVSQQNTEDDNANQNLSAPKYKTNVINTLDATEGDKVTEVDAKVIDEEIVTSENNSPFVSVVAEIEVIPENFENIDLFATKTRIVCTPPASPPIASKGYNFNFDEFEDPFATKTKIRLSPTPDTPLKPEEPKAVERKIEKPTMAKKEINNRRKSQPDRKRPPAPKRKLNSTFSGTTDSNIANKPIEKLEDVSPTIDTKLEEIKPEPIAYDKEDKEVQDIIKTAKENIEFKLKEALKLENEVKREDETEKRNEVPSVVEISSVDSIMETKNSSSSEQSTYYSAGTSSNESIKSRNVFNIPEIDDKNFNPFATKSKIHQSPLLNQNIENPFETRSKILVSPDIPLNDANIAIDVNEIKPLLDEKMNTEPMEKDSSTNISYTTTSSKATDERDGTIREVNTEDEDTVEGPFLEAEDLHSEAKMIHFDNEKDMLQVNKLLTQVKEENQEGDEMFIDAEAFEFLLNQNKSNTVFDSGKESLFLKFDPLFAKRMSSEGVLATLTHLQRRQSTPSKLARPAPKEPISPIASSSNMNVSRGLDTDVTEELNDDLNITVSKPMMVVPPAVNPVTPRNKSLTPTRSNRRSITFTSPAMAVIDRLLSLSGNNSSIHDNTFTQVSREQNEADLALTQLRELLAEKEIHVYNLRSESKELKDRLSTMESQVRSLEIESQDRLKKINNLTDCLAEKTRINKSMAAVVEEYERTIASLIAETEQDKKRHAEERMKLINERDEQTAHLASMEVSFSDLHSKYEKSKQVILSCKANEDVYKKSIKAFEENLTKMQNNYELLKQHATSKLNHANQELEKMNKAHEAEVLKLNAMIKRKDLHITSLEESLVQKTKANEELTAICDELINKVG